MEVSASFRPKMTPLQDNNSLPGRNMLVIPFATTVRKHFYVSPKRVLFCRVLWGIRSLLPFRGYNFILERTRLCVCLDLDVRRGCREDAFPPECDRVARFLQRRPPAVCAFWHVLIRRSMTYSLTTNRKQLITMTTFTVARRCMD